MIIVDWARRRKLADLAVKIKQDMCQMYKDHTGKDNLPEEVSISLSDDFKAVVIKIGGINFYNNSWEFYMHNKNIINGMFERRYV